MNPFLENIKKSSVVRFFYRLPFFTGTYHFSLAFLAALFYGFPSRKLIVVGVTGTKGKTTTCNLIADILDSAGFKTGLATTINFRIGDREWANETKQTMLGRFALQKLLAEMAKAGCRYAIIETSSEGILQYRQRFINYRTAVFTNLSPEHIERHGGFENYRVAKVKLFEQVGRKKNGIGIYNLDDESVEYFLKPDVKNKYGYAMKSSKFEVRCSEFEARGSEELGLEKVFHIANVRLGPNGSKFSFANEEFEMPLIGEFNVYNAAAAIVTAISQDIPLEKIQSAMKTVGPVRGRLEVIDKGQPFTLIVDYAHEPKSLQAIYESAKLFEPKRIIGLLGSQGGGRDRWKRSAMGKVAAEYCDVIILANEDPYDENPMDIMNDVESGVLQLRSSILPPSPRLRRAGEHRTVYKIIDRREAIEKAISIAQKGDVVVLTGKGGEVWMCLENGKKIPWDERKVAEETLSKKFLKQN